MLENAVMADVLPVIISLSSLEMFPARNSAREPKRLLLMPSRS